MCGIAGLLKSSMFEEERLAVTLRMCNAMAHRGPNDSGLVNLGPLSLGMRRLSIIDPSPDGHQPMTNEDDTIWMVANGEIYNYRELRADLAAGGHRLRSHTDVEVILHLYEEYGISCVSRLRGMFAFALWDSRTEELWLVRDRLGIKPLYYSWLGDGIIFASEIKGLLASGCVTSDLDWTALDLYLALGYVPGPKTLLTSVLALPPASYARVWNSQLEIKRYWELPSPGATDWPVGDIVENTRYLLQESVKMHQFSDVPLGVFLSGGTDSASVVGLMAAEGATIKTVTVGFNEGPAYMNELEPARRIAQKFHTDHSEIVITGREVRDELERMVWALDQPSFDGLNSYLVSQAARQRGLTVALSGLGGDELFGGYATYRVLPRWDRLAAMWGKVPKGLRRAATGALAPAFRNLIHRSKWARIRDVQVPADLYSVVRLALWSTEREVLYSNAAWSAIRLENGTCAEDLLRDCALGDSGWRLVTRLELCNYVGWRLLRDTDAMSMANSLEVRVPLLDDVLVEKIVGLPETVRARWGHPKRLLKASMSDLLSDILPRKKQGFQFPMAHWMTQELRPIVDDVFSRDSIRRRGLFNVETLQELHAAFIKGSYPYEVVWQFVMLELWLRQTVDRPAQASLVTPQLSDLTCLN